MSNKVSKIINRTAIVAFVMALSSVAIKSECAANAFKKVEEVQAIEEQQTIIDTLPIEDLPSYEEYLKNDTVKDEEKTDDYNTLENFYIDKMHFPVSMINDYSIQALNDEIFNYLGEDLYCKEYKVDIDSIKALFYNKEGKHVSLTKYNNNTFFANYGEDNWFIDAYTCGSEVFNKQFYAGENDFYRSEFNNNFLVNESIFYTNENGDMFAISLYDEGESKTLYIIPPYKDALPISISDDDYALFSIIMACYANGTDLNNFLLEKDFAKILDIVAIQDIDLYYELIGYDKSKTLKLTTL